MTDTSQLGLVRTGYCTGCKARQDVIEQQAAEIERLIAAGDGDVGLIHYQGEQIEQQAARIAKLETALETVVWHDHFGVMDCLISNGCEHGFKPAASCPNEGCSDRELHLLIRAALENTDEQ